MGFHAVAFGIKIAKHNNFRKLCKLIATKVYKTINNESMNILQEVDIDNEDFDNNYETIYRVQLYDDIVYKGELSTKLLEISPSEMFGVKFTYSENSQIKIGYPHICVTMIYLGCVGDDLGGKDGPIKINDETIKDLLEWKQQLIEQNRLEDSAILSMVGNCCS